EKICLEPTAIPKHPHGGNRIDLVHVDEVEIEVRDQVEAIAQRHPDVETHGRADVEVFAERGGRHREAAVQPPLEVEVLCLRGGGGGKRYASRDEPGASDRSGIHRLLQMRMELREELIGRSRVNRRGWAARSGRSRWLDRSG